MGWTRSLMLAGLWGLLATFSVAGELKLTLLDADSGKPLQNARVVIRANGDYPQEGGAQSGADGVCTVGTPVGEQYFSLLVRHPGHVTTSLTWFGHGEAMAIPPALTVKLPASKPISGHVVDLGGQPVAFARVVLSYCVDISDMKERPAIAPRLPDEAVETDEKGVWKYEGAPADKLDALQIRVEHPDFVSNREISLGAAGLLDGSASITLEAGVDVAGRVVGPDGKPIARATVTTKKHHYVSNDYGLTLQTDDQGRFMLEHQPKGPLPVTVMAKGFSPEMQMVEVKEGLTPLAFKLAAGRRIKGRVVDPAGKPVAGAYLSLDQWRNLSPIPWNSTSSADGRFEIADAPADGFELQVNKEGYLYKNDARIAADATDVTITLKPSVRVSGSVTDEQTGKPVTRFRASTGIAFWEGRPPFFQLDQAREFKDGKFDLKIQGSDSALALYFRIDADGYESFISSPITDGGGKVDVKLRPGKDFAGAVRNPDGTPAKGVEVWLVTPGAQVNLVDGVVGRGEVLKAKTDDAGRFRFSPQTGVLDILVTSDAGYALTRVEAGKADPEVKLLPWSAIEGSYQPHGKAVAQTLYVGVDPKSMAEDDVMYIWSYSPRTDENGHYRVNRLPGKSGEILRVQIGVLSETADERRWLPLKLEPGETTRVDVSPAGKASVKGRAIFAKGETPIQGGRGMVLLSEVSGLSVSQWPATTQDAMKRATTLYRADASADGSFSIPAVSPGNYEYSVTIYSGNEYGVVSGQITIAPDMAGKVVDLGEVGYVRRHAAAGESLPDVLGKRDDGTPILTAGFSGKYIVLVIWDSCSGSAKSHLPALEKLGETFGTDPGVALISVNSDALSCGSSGLPKRPAALKSEAWVRGHITLADQAILSRLIKENMPVILIAGPDGKIIANGLKGDEVAGKLREALKRQ